MADELVWDDWFKTVLRELRDQYAKLTDKDRDQITKRWGEPEHGCPVPFQSPTQLIVIWVRHPELDRHYQLVQIEHFTDRPDEEVAVYGPFPPSQYLEVTGPILEEARWLGHLHHDHAFTEAIRDRLVTAHQYVGPSLDDDRDSFHNQNGTLHMEWYASDIAFASFRDIRRTEPAQLVRDLLDHALGGRGSAAKQVSTVTRQPAPFNAIGWYSYRPFWIEEQPTLTYAQRLANQRPSSPSNKGWTMSYKGTNLLVWQHGFLAIEGDPERNLLRLSVLIASLQFLGIPFDLVDEAYAVRLAVEDDFSIVSIQEGSQQNWGSGILPPPRPSEDRVGVLKLGTLERAVKLAERLLGDRDLTEIPTLYDQAALLSERHREMTASFLFAWTVCERLIHRKISTLSLDPQRRTRLVNSRSVDPLIEILEIAAKISPAEYRDLMRWKNLRNNWIHKGRDVPGTEAPALLKYVQHAILGELGLSHADLIALAPLTR
jgi:hypothetical protein